MMMRIVERRTLETTIIFIIIPTHLLVRGMDIINSYLERWNDTLLLLKGISPQLQLICKHKKRNKKGYLVHYAHRLYMCPTGTV